MEKFDVAFYALIKNGGICTENGIAKVRMWLDTTIINEAEHYYHCYKRNIAMVYMFFCAANYVGHKLFLWILVWGNNTKNLPFFDAFSCCSITCSKMHLCGLQVEYVQKLNCSLLLL